MMGLPSCLEVESCLTDYMEGVLPLRKRLGIRIHLLMCALCSGLYRRLNTLSSFAKVMFAPPSDTPTPEAKVALDRALESLKKNHGHSH